MPILTASKTGPGTKGISFDGSASYLTKSGDLSGNANGKLGTISYWIKAGSDGALGNIVHGSPADVQITKAASNITRVLLRDASNATALDLRSSQVLVADGWVHIMKSWDIGNTLTHVYKDDVSDKTVTTLVDLTVDYTQANWGIAATSTGNSLLNAVLSELYVNFAEYIDLSVEANRRKFITASGSPANLGSDGSIPTGTAPLIYLPAGSNVIGENSGSGGDFTSGDSPQLIAGPTGGSRTMVIPSGTSSRRF